MSAVRSLILGVLLAPLPLAAAAAQTPLILNPSAPPPSSAQPSIMAPPQGVPPGRQQQPNSVIRPPNPIPTETTPGARQAVRLRPNDIKAVFFDGRSFEAVTLAGSRFRLTYNPDGTATRVALGDRAPPSSGQWRLSRDGFCTRWEGAQAENCFYLFDQGESRFAVFRVGAGTSSAIWHRNRTGDPAAAPPPIASPAPAAPPAPTPAAAPVVTSPPPVSAATGSGIQSSPLPPLQVPAPPPRSAPR